MGAPTASPWLLWALIGFGPSIVILCAGIRALARNSGACWTDFQDASTLLGWITPGLTVLAAMPLAGARLSPVALGLWSAMPVIAYTIIGLAIAQSSEQYRKAGVSALTSVRVFISREGCMHCVAIFMFLRALVSPDSVGRVPNIDLFLGLLAAGRIGGWLLGMLTPSIGEWKRLAPSDLYKRVIEIASKAKVEVEEVRVLVDYPFQYVGALAHSGNGVCFSEELIMKLNKDEVDAVIAHEVGHLADNLYWYWSYPAYIVLAVAGLGAARYLLNGIAFLPAPFQFLQYVVWMAMFLVPGLIRRAYSRHIERKADANVAVLDNPGAAISGYYKLRLLSDMPTTRPWWSRLLGTHPTMQEDMDTIARRSGLTAGQVDQAKRRAETEAESGPSDRYDLTFHEEPKSEIEKRGREAVDVAVILGAVVAGALVFGTSFFLLMRHEPEGWTVALAIFGMFSATALTIILPIDTYQKRKNSRLRGRIRTKLASKYGESLASSMLLVDAHLNQDEGVWQGALIGVRDGRLVVLAESREVSVPLDAGLMVERFTRDTYIGDDARMVAIWYEVDSVRQWIVIRNLGRPEKGLPRKQKDLERYVQGLITGAGGTIRKERKVPVRQVLVRAPIALVVLAATVGLVELLVRLTGFDGSLVVHGVVLSGVGSALYAWVAKRPHPEESHEVETQL